MAEQIAVVLSRTSQFRGQTRLPGTVLLVGEPGEDLLRQDVEKAIKLHRVEVRPADEALAMEKEKKEAAAAAEKARRERRERAAKARPPASVAAPLETQEPPPLSTRGKPDDQPEPPEAELVEEAAEPEVTGAAEGDPEAAAIAETMKQGDELAELLALTKPQLIKRAEKEKATFSSRATKEQIAQEIIEVRAARKAD